MSRLLLLALVTLLGLVLPGSSWAQDDEEIEEAQITKNPEILEVFEAVYPPLALRQRIEAEVILEIEISETGTISDVAVIRTTAIPEALSATTAEAYGIVRSSTISDYGFAQAAVDAVSKMRFSPAEAEGIPIPVRVPFNYAFDLPPLPPPPSESARDPDRPGLLSIRGKMRERGTRTVIPGAVITVFRGQEGEDLEGYEAISNEQGVFEFFDLSPGKWRIQGEVDGYFPLRDSLKVIVGEVTEVTYYLEKGSYSPYDVFVEVEAVKREVNRRTLTREEIRTVPGTLGDPILVIENLPGVARPAAGSGDIIVRGSGTADTRVYVDGVEVPIIYHFFGLKSVLPIDVIETVDFYPGNFSVFYGRGTGGVFDAHIRDLDPDQVHGTVELSTLDVSLFATAPITDNFAVAVGGRRSVIGEILEEAIPDGANASIVAPVYYDGQFLANWRPAAGHDFRAFIFGSDDALRVFFDNPSDINPQLTSNQATSAVNFQRATLEYRFAPNDNVQNQALLSAGRNFIRFNFTDFFFNLESLQLLFRNTTRFKVDDALRFRVGIDLIGSQTDVQSALPGSPPAEGQTGTNTDLETIRESDIEDFMGLEAGAFVEAEWQPIAPLTLVPGVRLDYFSLVEQWSADPRLVARYQFDDVVTVKGGVGLVYQPPQAFQALRPFGNPATGLQRAIQYSLGVEIDVPDGIPVLSNMTFDLTAFYKDLDDFLTASALRDEEGEPLFFDNTAIGRVYGLEAFIEHKFADNFRGWVAYTLSRSERRDAAGEPWRLFDFDQTHIFNMVASYTLPESWEIGIRLRLISGNPFSPSLNVVENRSSIDQDLGIFQDLPGDVNSQRLPFFGQLDIRVEKGWVFDWFRLKAFLSIINTWNRENPEGLSLSPDRTQQDFASGLPVFPNLGLRAEF